MGFLYSSPANRSNAASCSPMYGTTTARNSARATSRGHHRSVTASSSRGWTPSLFDVPLGLSVSSLVQNLSDERCRGPRSLLCFRVSLVVRFLSRSGSILATSIAELILRSGQGERILSRALYPHYLVCFGLWQEFWFEMSFRCPLGTSCLSAFSVSGFERI